MQRLDGGQQHLKALVGLHAPEGIQPKRRWLGNGRQDIRLHDQAMLADEKAVGDRRIERGHLVGGELPMHHGPVRKISEMGRDPSGSLGGSHVAASMRNGFVHRDDDGGRRPEQTGQRGIEHVTSRACGLLEMHDVWPKTAGGPIKRRNSPGVLKCSVLSAAVSGNAMGRPTYSSASWAASTQTSTSPCDAVDVA